MGTYDVKQLGHHGSDAAEVAGPALGFQALAHGAGGADEGQEAGGVDVGGMWGEDDVHAGVFEQGEVAREVTRIAREVFAGAKLRRVHEDADGQNGALGPSLAHEAEVAGMEVAHRGDQTDDAGCRVQARTLGHHVCHGLHNAHDSLPPAWCVC